MLEEQGRRAFEAGLEGVGKGMWLAGNFGFHFIWKVTIG